MGGEVVQRLFSPALGRKLVDQARADGQVFIVVAEVAVRDRIEEQCLPLPRCLVVIGPDAFARRPRLLLEVIALGEAQLNELLIVALGRGAQVVENRPRRRVPLAAEQALGASELEFVAVRSGHNRRDRQRLQLRLGDRREITERELVEHARKRFDRLVRRAGRLRRPSQPHQHVVGRSGLRLRQALVDGERGCLIVQRLGCVGLAQRCGFGEEADRVLRAERLEGLARVGGAPETQFRDALVVLSVAAEHALPDGLLLEQRQRAREVAVDLEPDRRGEIVHRRRGRGVPRRGQPEL